MVFTEKWVASRLRHSPVRLAHSVASGGARGTAAPDGTPAAPAGH